MADPLFPSQTEADPVEWLRQRQGGPTMSALTSLDDSPDDAAEASKLSRDIGVPPNIVHTNLEDYQAQHKAALTTALMDNNEHLREYVRQHPLGASVSNDDWGQLDEISNHLDKFLPPKFQPVRLARGLASVAEHAAQGFKEGYGEDEIEPAVHKWLGNSDIVDTILKIWQTNPVYYAPRIMQGVLTGAAAGGGEAIGRLTGANEAQRASLARDLLILPQVAIPEFAEFHVPPELQQLAARAQRSVAPFAEAGERPPPRSDPIVFHAAAEEAKLDLKNFDELYKEVQKSSTLARDPEAFNTFGRIKLGDSTVGISADAVRELYGDTRPTPDDNKLGWAPYIAEQYDASLAHGGDVEVPLADLLAKSSPETMDTIREGMRLRHGGLTFEETKELKPIELPEVKPPEGLTQTTEDQLPHPALDSVRQVAGVKAPIITAKEIENRAVPGVGIIPEETRLGEKATGSTISVPALHSFDARDGLARIGANIDQLHGLPKVLATFFGEKIKELAGDTPVRVVSDANWKKLADDLNLSPTTAAYHWVHTNEIVIKESTLRDPNHAAYVLLHEGAHAMTSQALHDVPLIRYRVDDMIKETRAWLEQTAPNLTKQYAFKDAFEFVAEGFSNPEFQEILATTPISKDLARRLGMEFKGKSIWDAVKGIVSDLIHKLTGVRIEDTMLDGLLSLGKELEQEKQYQLRDTTPRPTAAMEKDPESAALFAQAQAIGMNADRLAKHMELIEKLRKENAEFAKNQEILKSGAAATKDWKDNLERVREEVKSDILRRPDIAADRFLRTGELPNGQKLQKTKLLVEDPEQRRGLPAEFLGDRGVNPDDLANIFGYQSGRELVRDLARMEEMRKVEGTTPAAQLRALVDAETQRRMERDYGRSAAQILADAKEQVVSPTQQDLLINELQGLYEANGQKPISKDAIVRFVQKSFDTIPVSLHNASKYLETAGKYGDKFGEALLDGKPVEALQFKQQQVLHLQHAKLAMKLEKLRGQFEKSADKWSRREPPGIPQTHAVWIHTILNQVGRGIKGIQDLERRKQLADSPKDLGAFVDSINSLQDIYNSNVDAMPPGQKMPVASFLRDPDYSTRIEDMTPPEFKAFFDSLKTIDHDGRTVNKYDSAQGKLDLAETVGGLVEAGKAAVGNEPISLGPSGKPGKPSALGRRIGAAVLSPHTWFHRLDLFNEFGRFNQLIGRPITEGNYTIRKFHKEFQELWNELKFKGNLQEKVHNDLFMDPLHGTEDPKTGERVGSTVPLPMTRESVLAVAANMGNELQRQKLMKPYGITDVNKVWGFLKNNGITREDMLTIQKMGKIWDKAYGYAEVAHEKVSGVAPARIELYTVQTPWGELGEWYHPLIPDPLRRNAKIKPGDMMEETGVYRPSPPSGYTKARTGAMYPLDLSFDHVPARLQQILNDAAMRPAVTEVGKIIFNDKFQTMFKNFYGPEYNTALKEWLSDSAGQRQWMPSTEAGTHMVLNYIRRNMSTLLIGLNLGTLMKHFPTALVYSMHQVGPIRFLNSFGHMFAHDTPLGQMRLKFAYENSEELQNRFHSTAEAISASNLEIFRGFTPGAKFLKAQDIVNYWGASPIAASDLLVSSVMWDAAYRKFSGEGMDHGAAVYAANRAVVRTHGSTLTSNRAAIMRASPWWQMVLPFYNFFSNTLQRAYEYGTQAKMVMQGGRETPAMKGFEGEKFEKGMKNIPAILGGLMVYGVVPSIFEQIADPLPQKEDEDPAFYWSKVFLRGPAATVPLVRNFTSFFLEGHDPEVGLLGSAMKDIARPVLHGAQAGVGQGPWISHPETVIKDINTIIGVTTGLTFAEVGKLGSFLSRYSQDLEDPEGFLDYYNVYRHGTTKERK